MYDNPSMCVCGGGGGIKKGHTKVEINIELAIIILTLTGPFSLETPQKLNISDPSLIVGYLFKLAFTSGTHKLIYVPEDSVFNPDKFKKHFDRQVLIGIRLWPSLTNISQEQRERMTLLAPHKAWKDLMRKLVLMYPTLPVQRNMHFVENNGFQVKQIFLMGGVTKKNNNLGGGQL